MKKNNHKRRIVRLFSYMLAAVIMLSALNCGLVEIQAKEILSSGDNLTDSAKGILSSGDDFTDSAKEILSSGDSITDSVGEISSAGDDFMNPDGEIPSAGEDFTVPSGEIPSAGDDFTNPEAQVPDDEETFEDSGIEIPQGEDTDVDADEQVPSQEDDANTSDRTEDNDFMDPEDAQIYANSYISAGKTLYRVPETSRDQIISNTGASLSPAYRSDQQEWAKDVMVKDQKKSALCWAFAMTTAAEYSYSKEVYETTGTAGIGFSLSPGHIGQFLDNRVNDLLSNTAGDENYPSNGTHWAVRGGSEIYGMQHWAGWSGAADEDTAPFWKVTDGIKNGQWIADREPYDEELAYDDAVILQESVVYFGNDKDAQETINKDIKQLILRYGAVSAATEMNTGKYMNLNEKGENGKKYSSGRSFYNYTQECRVNHAVTIIGWDDNYPKENFAHSISGKSDSEAIALTTPHKDGAWIIQNSWGAQNHDGGIYYMSYESADLQGKKAEIYAFDMQPADTYLFNFYYDGTADCGDTYDSGNERFFTGPGTMAANVFTNTTGGPITLDAVGYTVFNDGLTEYQVDVYTGLTDANDPLSGTLASTSMTSSVTSGCKTAVLDRQVPIRENETYSIVFKFSGRTRFGIEKERNNFAVHTDPGQSFFCSAGSKKWKDMNSYGACFRIKGFANRAESIENAKVVLSAASYVYNKCVQRPSIKTIGGKKLVAGRDYTASWSCKKSVYGGTYSVTITGIGRYLGTTEASYKITPAANTLTVTGKTAVVSYKQLANANRSVTRSKILTVSGARGTLTYTLSSVSKSKYKKYFSIDKKSGKLTVKKGLPKGTYSLTVKVQAAGNNSYKKASRTRLVKIQVK